MYLLVMLRTPKPRLTPSNYPRMQQWSPLHYTMLTLAIVACGVFTVVAKRLRGKPKEAYYRAMVGWVLLITGTAWTIISLDPKQFDVRESLPLHLCDVLRPILAVGLITGNESALSLSYYWGVLLNPQAIITPDVIYYFEPRWVRNLTYWFFHIVALAIPVALTFGSGYRPTWGGYRQAVGITSIWMAVTMWVNKKTDGNYGFLNHAPGSPSIIDIFGPWPIYIIQEVIGVAISWAGLTWPWETERGRKGTKLVGPRGLLRKLIR
ncbi:YwaF family protein [Corynebacterium camporealensis]